MWQQNRRIYDELEKTKKTFLTIILCMSISCSPCHMYFPLSFLMIFISMYVIINWVSKLYHAY